MSMMYIRILVDLHIKYYTDWHDVDEDSKTIVNHGGGWTNEAQVGIMLRYLWGDKGYVAGDVASNAKI